MLLLLFAGVTTAGAMTAGAMVVMTAGDTADTIAEATAVMAGESRLLAIVCCPSILPLHVYIASAYIANAVLAAAQGNGEYDSRSCDRYGA